MGRLIPLLKMNARIVVAGIVLAAVYWLAAQVTLEYRGSRWLYYFKSDVIITGIGSGLLISIPMTLTILVFFRDIERPLFFRFAMLTVALMAVLGLWGHRADPRDLLLSPGPQNRWLIIYAFSSIFFALLVYCSSLAAQAYAREVQEQALARQEREIKIKQTKL